MCQHLIRPLVAQAHSVTGGGRFDTEVDDVVASFYYKAGVAELLLLQLASVDASQISLCRAAPSILYNNRPQRLRQVLLY